MKKIVCLLFVTAFMSAAVFADIPRPKTTPTKTQKSIDSTLHIAIRKDAKEAKLIIPKSQLNQLRAQLDNADDNSNAASAVGTYRTQTIMSGVFLSLALVFGGIWLVRSGKISSKSSGVIAAFFAIGFVASAAVLVYGNAGPPAEARAITGKMFSQSVHIYKFGYGAIKLETKEEGDQIELVVPDVADKPNNEE